MTNLGMRWNAVMSVLTREVEISAKGEVPAEDKGLFHS